MEKPAREHPSGFFRLWRMVQLPRSSSMARTKNPALQDPKAGHPRALVGLCDHSLGARRITKHVRDAAPGHAPCFLADTHRLDLRDRSSHRAAITS
jgi:hypothetical protein